MKKYEPKKRPTFNLPGGDDPKKKLLSGLGIFLILCILMILISRSSVFEEESLADYRQKHPIETLESD